MEATAGACYEGKKWRQGHDRRTSQSARPFHFMPAVSFSSNSRFVDRYIPGYHFFGRGVLEGGVDPHTGELLTPPWVRKDGMTTKLLRVTIGEGREVLNTQKL